MMARPRPEPVQVVKQRRDAALRALVEGVPYIGFLGVEFERRGRRAVSVRPDVAGEPAQGFHLEAVTVDPRRVWLAGARSEVERLAEVVTEPIDIAGLEETEKREASLSLGAGNVWMEESKPVSVTIRIEPDEVPEPEVPQPIVEGQPEEPVPG